MGCGKGGDLEKWSKARIREYVGMGTLPFLTHRDPPPKLLLQISLPSLSIKRVVVGRICKGVRQVDLMESLRLLTVIQYVPFWHFIPHPCFN